VIWTAYEIAMSCRRLTMLSFAARERAVVVRLVDADGSRTPRRCKTRIIAPCASPVLIGVDEAEIAEQSTVATRGNDDQRLSSGTFAVSSATLSGSAPCRSIRRGARRDCDDAERVRGTARGVEAGENWSATSRASIRPRRVLRREDARPGVIDVSTEHEKYSPDQTTSFACAVVSCSGRR